MFFDDDRKKISTIIKGRRDRMGNRTMEPTEMKSEISKHEDGEMDGRHVAMQDFMAAHNEGSPQKMADALSNFIDIHHGMHKDAESPAGE